MQVSIASGKGGTGKTTVAVNLAAVLARRSGGPSGDTKIQLLDCDVEEPNCHIYLRPELTRSVDVEIPVPRVDESRCTRCGLCGEACAFHAILPGKRVLVLPELCHGCGACAYLCPEKCITEVPRKIGVMQTGPVRLAGSYRDIDFVHGILNPGEALAAPLAKRVRREADPNGLVIIDSPPGTSCTMMASVKKSDLCLLVTEPTPFGLHDLQLAYEAVTRLGIPSAVIVNRAGIGDDRVTRFCESNEIPLLAEIHLDREMARVSAAGYIAAEVLPNFESLFSGILDRAIQMVSEKRGTGDTAEGGPKR
ncbi:MAG: ATP-binding protein [Bacillota bacterium]|nr:P-loop NTPase [Candidatus Fermentithermobacillaceae bacterium]